MSSWDDDEEAASAAVAATTDVELLKRAWRNEKAAPEVLRFHKDLVDRVKEQIKFVVRHFSGPGSFRSRLPLLRRQVPVSDAS